MGCVVDAGSGVYTMNNHDERHALEAFGVALLVAAGLAVALLALWGIYG